MRAPVAHLTRYAHRCIGIEPTGDAKTRVRVALEHDGARRSIDDIDLVVASDGRYSGVPALCCGMPAGLCLRAAIPC